MNGSFTSGAEQTLPGDPPPFELPDASGVGGADGHFLISEVVRRIVDQLRKPTIARDPPEAPDITGDGVVARRRRHCELDERVAAVGKPP